MEEFDSIEDVAEEIKNKLDKDTGKKKILALYAFNSTGKTRISNILNNKDSEDEEDIKKVLCYNIFLEDIFSWNNDDYILRFDKNSWISKFVLDQGLENNIIGNFKSIIDYKIEPSFDFDEGEVIFNFVSGDSNSRNNIKISKGEESVFIWSFFYTILEIAIESLNDDINKTTSTFDDLEYVIIDDPVSSIDDTKIIAIAIKLVELIKACNNKKIKFLITTHHALFYNVLVNSFKNKKEKNPYNFDNYILSKDNYIFKFLKQNDSPFSYHLIIKNIIERAIKDNDIKRYHFNLFRNLLEKTSNFLGYNNWSECLSDDNKEKFIRLLNLYSHNKISELESKELPGEDKLIFQQTFNDFISKFKWN